MEIWECKKDSKQQEQTVQYIGPRPIALRIPRMAKVELFSTLRTIHAVVNDATSKQVAAPSWLCMCPMAYLFRFS